jgi:membrane-associated phospholipid phosphatase
MWATRGLLHWDLLILHVLNGLHGHGFVDGVVRFAVGNQLLEGTVFLAAYWYFWFGGLSRGVAESRRILLAGIVAGLAAIFMARLLGDFLPFRTRPLADPFFFGFRFPSNTGGANYEDWSSFPSDHVAFTFALSFALYPLAPRVSIALAAYSIVAVGLTRTYLGIHYPSDIVAGAAIGSVAAWSCQKAVKGKVVDAVLAFAERHPPWFYLGGFIITCELAEMFANVRQSARALRDILHLSTFETAVILGIATVAVLSAAGLVTHIMRRRVRLRAAKKPGEPNTVVPL